MHFALRLLLTGCFLLKLMACSGTAPTPESPVPTSVLACQKTIQQATRERTVHRKGTAGFEMLAGGEEAYLARLAAVEAAQQTLDFQYFIWADDATGTIFAERLLAAADRGVKVRLLLDITKGAQKEVKKGVLASHPNIEVALFNPMTAFQGFFAGNPLPIIGEIDRMQSRMHNKMLIADNAILIGGGRNLGDTYFGVDRKHNMRDLDYIASGPVVNAATKSFNLYWESPLTRKVGPSETGDENEEKLVSLRRELRDKKLRLARKGDFPFPLKMARVEALQRLNELSGKMVWDDYEFVADPPERMLSRTKEASPVWRTKEGAIRGAKKEVLMHAAYLIPQEEVLGLFKETSDRGVKVRMLTNSLSSIDGLLAMTGIANRRKDILETGAEYYELKSDAPVKKEYVRVSEDTLLGMHTKGLVVDNRISFIGSYNMDPRSKYINTETGVIINSGGFAKRLKGYLLEDMQPENCWQVTCEEDGRFCWTCEMPGKPPVRHYRDPDVPLRKRISYWMLLHMPWENLL
ncbi:putative cardiolipin synthase [Prosthecobacter fusiformis]|uniref:Putative cardiolipin synthase n=2 Tax=Prosthecobacter fusiformis TaxID=48464 RepID=A0A4R7SSJ4_9BACT|nr:putative cardiolipin synthase [Prosthecobacter fusiformis]